MTQTNERIHYLDNLRALAMLMGIFFHAAVAYSPMMTELWLSAGPEQSQVMEIVSWFTHLFRMPLFFMISGFFALLLIERRGMRGFLKNRGLRIATPFVVFMPLMIIAIFGTVGWAMQAIENPGPMLTLIKVMSQNPDAPKPPFSTMHLWFLFNLILFCLTLALMVKYKLHKMSWLVALVQPKWLLSLVPLLLVPALTSQVSPHPAAERIYPELWSFGFYGIFFLLGSVLYGRLEVLDSMKKYTAALIIISALLYIIVYRSFPTELSLVDAMAMAEGPKFSLQHLFIATLESYIAVYMTIACLNLGKQYLSGSSRVMRYIADSSYWVYIIHLPLIFYIQFLLLDVNWGAWTEFWVSSLGTMALGLVSYAFFVRWTPVGILLNGRRVPLKEKPQTKQWA